jgi:hypothetical protein
MQTPEEKLKSRNDLACSVAEGIANSAEQKQQAADLKTILQTTALNAALLQQIMVLLNSKETAVPKKAARAPAGSAAAATGGAPVFANVLLFYKYAFANRIDEIYGTFSAPMYADRIKTEMEACQLAGALRDKKYSTLLWSKLSQAEKDSVRPSFKAYTEAAKRESTPPQLDVAADEAVQDNSAAVPEDDYA